MDRFQTSFWIYQDSGSPGNHFFTWVRFPESATEEQVDISGSWTKEKHSGATAIRCEFHNTNGHNFGGFIFQNGFLRGDDKSPESNFGTEPEAGIDLTGVTELRFWAKGDRGGEVIRFFMGGVGWDPAKGIPRNPCTPQLRNPCLFPDSTPEVPIQETLTTSWRQYHISLAGRDLHYVLGGFGWTADAAANPEGAVFYMDDIEYVLARGLRQQRLEQPRFLVSYETNPYQDSQPESGRFDLILRNTAYTYDNALAILAFLADGTPDSIRRARLIGDAFVWASQHDRAFTDGRLRSSYQPSDITLPPGWRANGRAGTPPIPGFYNESSDSALSSDDLIDLKGLARRLLAADDRLSMYIKKNLSAETLKLLQAYASDDDSLSGTTDKCSGRLIPPKSLVEDLNRLIQGKSLSQVVDPENLPVRNQTSVLALQRANRHILDQLLFRELLHNQSFIETGQSAVDTGDNAWGMISLLALYQVTHDDNYLKTARRIGRFIWQFKDDTNGYQGFTGGLELPENGSIYRPWASTEHNLDVYVAFTKMFQITGESQWRDGALHALKFIEAMWDDDAHDAENGCFLAGTLNSGNRNASSLRAKFRPNEPNQLPLDTQSWSILALKDVLSTHPDLLKCPEKNHLIEDSRTEGISGFDFNEDKDGVWFEGTAQMVLAYKVAGRLDRAEYFQNELRRAQSDLRFGQTGGLPAASHDGVTSGFEFCYFRRTHLGATAWNVFAQIGFNPYYQEFK